MGTTAQKLQKILDSKAAIKAAIEAKTGGTAGDVMADYANQINNIPTPDYEVVNIKLTTNQGTDSGIETVAGKKSSYIYDIDEVTYFYEIRVTVDGESKVRKFPWMGKEITTLVPSGKKYTVNVYYINPPSGPLAYALPTFKTDGYTAVAGNVRNIIGVFSCEKITVKLVNEQQTAIIGQNITIQTSAGSYTYAYTAANWSNFVFLIPTGTEYTVSFSIRSGYNSPASQTYTANQQTREITGIYTIPQLGVFILDGNNNRVNIDDWSASMGAIGIAVATSDCSFVVHPDGAVKASAFATSNVVNKANLPRFETINNAKTDFNGSGNTDKLLTVSTNLANNPAYLCSQKTIDGVVTQSCYLPAVGEVFIILSNLTLINSALSKIGKSTIFNTYYIWTSTANGTGNDLWMEYNNGSLAVYTYLHPSTAHIIPIAELKSIN